MCMRIGAVIRSRTDQYGGPREPQLYHALLAYATDLVAVLGPDATIRYASPSWQQTLGYAPDDVEGTNAFDKVFPEDVPRVQEAFVRGLQLEGTPVRVQYRFRHADQTWRVIESTGSSHLSDPLVHGFVVNSRDITERVEAEERLRQSETRHRSIVEAAFDGLVITDLDGIIVEANPAAHRMYGYEQGELIGRQVASIIHPESLHLVDRYVKSVTETGWGQEDFINVRKDGTPFHVEVRGTQFIYRDRPHRLAVARDVTERIEAEVAVLEERRRLARELHDSVSQVLFGIRVATETTRRLLPGDPRAAIESLGYIGTLAKGAMVEMRALLFDLRPESLESEGLVAGLQKQAEALAVRHEIATETSLGAEPSAPLEVKEALYRIAQEAMHNVFKHAQATRARVSLSSGDGEVILEVGDNGTGFDAAASFPGHIGLQSMKERAMSVGGTFEVESSHGRGTLVRARLPFSRTQ